MVKRRFLFAAVFVAAILTSISLLTACEKEDEVQKDGTEQTDKKGGSAQDGDSTANVEVKIVGTQVANIGETHATLLCRFTKADGSDFTQAEIEALMNLNPQGGFCLVEGDGVPTIKDSTINCIESARQGGVMNGTFNNLKKGTSYSVRAWLTVDGTSIYYGEKVTFTTQGNAQPEIAISLVGMQVANVGDSYAVLLCRITKSNGETMTPAELDALMNLNPRAGFCLVKGDGTPTIKNSTINCIESARQGGVMSGTFNNLMSGTKYSVRAWLTVDGNTIYYGETATFTTQGNVVPQGYVDLGLQSGTLWKDQNESGQDYYTYDEAVAQFGDKLPTKEQLEELKESCQWQWTGSGYKVTGPNGNSITLPAAGYRNCNGDTGSVGSDGDYWSSTPNVSCYAWNLYFDSSSVYMNSRNRCSGGSVRLVQD